MEESIEIHTKYDQEEKAGIIIMEKKSFTLDHAATTATRPEVVDAQALYFTENFWNPSSVYTPAFK